MQKSNATRGRTIPDFSKQEMRQKKVYKVTAFVAFFKVFTVGKSFFCERFFCQMLSFPVLWMHLCAGILLFVSVFLLFREKHVPNPAPG